MKTVVDAAKISPSSFYYHFSSIEDLVEYVLEESRLHIASLIRRRDTWHSPAAITLIDVWFAVLIATPRQGPTFIEKAENSPRGFQKLQSVQQQLYAYTYRNVRAAIQEGDLGEQTNARVLTENIVRLLDIAPREARQHLDSRVSLSTITREMLEQATAAIRRSYVNDYLDRRAAVLPQDWQWRITVIER